jgi:6-pyruvoyltetrahydropterin/6-carboxytetrahydropterin synthase
MRKVRLSKEFRFEMGHALLNYDGLCRHIHGHSYKLIITVHGEPVEDKLHPKMGMVMDFSDLKAAVKKPIVDHFDHSLVINKDAEEHLPIDSHAMYDKVHCMDLCRMVCL